MSYCLGTMGFRMTAIAATIRTLRKEAAYNANYLLAGLGFVEPLLVSLIKF